MMTFAQRKALQRETRRRPRALKADAQVLKMREKFKEAEYLFWDPWDHTEYWRGEAIKYNRYGRMCAKVVFWVLILAAVFTTLRELGGWQ